MEFENKKLRSVAETAARIMMGEKALHPNQQKLDVHEPEKDKLTSDDFKKLRSMKKEETMHEESCGCGACPSDKDMKKEEVDLEEMDKGGYRATRDDDDYTKGKQITVNPKSVMSAKSATSSAFRQLNKAFNKDSEKKDMKKEEVDLDEGKMGQLSADLKDLSHADFHKEYGNPKSHYDPSNFKKPVQKGKEMDRAKSLAQRAMASMKKEEVESLEEYKSTAGVYKHQGTYGTEKSIESGFTDYDKENELAKKHLSPKKPVKKGARQNRNFNTKLYKEGFSALISSYSENGMKGLFESLKKEYIIAEEPTSAEFAAQLDDAKKRAAGTKKQPEVSKPAVQAVQNEEVGSVEEQTHTTVSFIDYNDVNGVKYAEIDLAERKLTDAETEKKEDTVKSMKKNLAGFKERYGKDAKSVMYATATARAKGE